MAVADTVVVTVAVLETVVCEVDVTVAMFTFVTVTVVDGVMVAVEVSCARVVVLAETPSQEQAEEYRAVPEQAEA